jgi:chemotaxis protein MotB
MKTLSIACVATGAFLLAGCVSQQKYDALDQEYQQLQQTMSTEVGAQQVQITRLQNAIKVSVNGELLFPSGGWEMPAQAQQTIAKMAAILAPQQTTKINVNGYTDNTPIGPGLMRQGVTSNLILSQKRADNVMQYMISQGVKPNLVSAQGFGDRRAGRRTGVWSSRSPTPAVSKCCWAAKAADQRRVSPTDHRSGWHHLAHSNPHIHEN